MHFLICSSKYIRVKETKKVLLILCEYLIVFQEIFPLVSYFVIECLRNILANTKFLH